MALQLRPVYSSHVRQIGYDPEAEELHVEYNTGRVVRYHGVDAKTADAVIRAPSIGGALHGMIRGKFEFSG